MIRKCHSASLSSAKFWHIFEKTQKLARINGHQLSPLSTWQRNFEVTQKSTLDGKSDITTTVTVIDSDPGGRDKLTVVGVHGIPGKGEDFEPLITRLSERGVRFVAPTFAGFQGSLLEPWQLKHVDFSTTGLASFLKILLDKMGVERIDMVMCHSAGSWLGYKMLGEWENVRSACLLSPVGATPHKMLRPHWVVRSVSQMLGIQYLHPISLPVMSWLYGRLGFSGMTPGTHLVASNHIVASPEFHNVHKFVDKLLKRKLPVFIAHAKNDKIVEWEIPKEVVARLGISVEEMQSESDKKMVLNENEGSSLERLSRVFLFNSGGHVVHKPHTEVIFQQVINILSSLGGVKV